MHGKRFSGVLALVLFGLLLTLTACGDTVEASPDAPEEEMLSGASGGYEQLDLKALAGDIYSRIALNDLLAGSVEEVTDTQVLTEQFYLPDGATLQRAVFAADGRFGAADLCLFRVAKGRADDLIQALESRKGDRIAEFSAYDVNDSYEIALNADIYQDGELVVMLMFSDENKTLAREIIDAALPTE